MAFHELWFSEGDAFMTSPLPIEGMNGVWWSQEERLLLAKVCVVCCMLCCKARVLVVNTCWAARQTASTAYFCTLLHVRLWVLFTCKTVERSLFQHGTLSCLLSYPTLTCLNATPPLRPTNRDSRQSYAVVRRSPDFPHPDYPGICPGDPVGL